MTHLYEHQRMLFSLPVQVPPREMLYQIRLITVHSCNSELASQGGCVSQMYSNHQDLILIEDASTTVLPGRHWIITLYTMMKVEVLQGLHGPGARGPCADPS